MSKSWSPDFKSEKHLVNLTDGAKVHKELCPACGDALTGKEAKKGILCVSCAASESQIRAHERAAVLAEVRDEWATILGRSATLTEVCNKFSDTFRKGGRFEVPDGE